MTAEVFDYVPTSAPSEWAEDVAKLKALPEGKGLAIVGGKTARTAFQRAARDEGFTARCVSTTDLGDDQFKFGFIAAELRTRKTKDADADADADAEVADTE